MSPNQKTDRGLCSWDLLWVDTGTGAEEQLRTFLLEDKPPREVLIAGGCGALERGFASGTALYANEVLDPRRGPHWPRPPRSLSLAAVKKALGTDVRTGKFLTTEAPCVTPSHKLESGHGYGAVAVDLDSAVLCRPCIEMDLGHAVLRFVVDPAEVDLTPGVPGMDAAFFEGARECEMSLFTLLAKL